MLKISQTAWLGIASVVVVFGLIGFVVYEKGASAVYGPFASCLTEKGTKMYGTWWCSNCQAQKKMFGNAFGSIIYTECSSPNQKDQLPVCQEAGVGSYPTWEFSDGSRLVGVQTFETLSQRTGCALPQGNR